MDAPEAGLGAPPRLLHLDDVGDIGGDHLDLAAKGLERLQHGDAPGGGAVGARPFLARGQRGAGEQHDARLVAADQFGGDGLADAAEAAGDEPGGALGQVRQALRGQRGGGVAGLVALVGAQGGGAVGGAGGQFLQHVVEGFGAGRVEIEGREGDAGQFARRDPGDSGDGGLFRVLERLARDLGRAGGEGGDMERRAGAFGGPGLHQEQQAEEALFEIAVKEARAGAEALGLGHQPEMGDARGQAALGGEAADQFVIGRAALLRGQEEARLAICLPARLAERGKGIAGANGGDFVARLSEAPGGGRAQPGLVEKDEPALLLGQLKARRAVGRGPFPCGRIAPVGHVLLAHGQDGGAGGGLVRRDVIGRALEGVGRQRQAAAPGLAPDLRPVEIGPQRPEPAQRGDEIRVVGHRVIRVAQGGDDLIRRDVRVRLGERGERAAGADLDQDAPGRLGQVGDAIGEKHGVAQVVGPVIGAGGLLRGEGLSGAVGDHRQARRV